jgi:hypothetical protein
MIDMPLVAGMARPIRDSVFASGAHRRPHPALTYRVDADQCLDVVEAQLAGN